MTIDVLAVFPNDFPGTSKWEGSRTRVSGQIRGLVDAKLRVALACVEDRSLPKSSRSSYNGVPLISISHPMAFNLHHALFPLFATFRLPHIIRTLKPKIAHFHLTTSGLALTTSSYPDVIKVYDLHDMFFLKEEFLKRWENVPGQIGVLCDAIEVNLFSRFDAVFVTTPLMRKIVAQYSNIPTYVIPNGIDTEFLSIPKENEKSDSKFTVGYLGSTKRILGFYEFVKAIALLRTRIHDISGLVIGTYDEKAYDFVRRHDLRDVIHFKGHVPYRDLPRLIGTMNVALSLRQRNTSELELADFYQATKLLEFMSCGVPVVATPLMEQSRIIAEAGCGVIARGYSSEEIADAVIEIHSRQSEMPTMGLRGRAHVSEHHAWPKIIAKILEAYRELEIR
jgi:glycosyltransferase involved in cell wall biosynthesis